MELLGKSIHEVGAIESISVTKEGTIISGHARKETFDKQGLTGKEIHLKAGEYPVIVRDDIEDNTPLYFKAQILANTSAKKNIDLDIEEITAIAEEYDFDIEEAGVDVEVIYNPDNIDLDSFFEEDNSKKENKNKIILEYTDEEFELVNEALKNHSGSKEQIFFKLLGL